VSPLTGDRRFESTSLQERVHCELAIPKRSNRQGTDGRLHGTDGSNPVPSRGESCANLHAGGRMIRRRAAAAGIAAEIGCHTFRATGITAYLSNGGALEHAQEMAAHESPRTTKLYDRTKERLTQDEVERIGL
jgi:integrase